MATAKIYQPGPKPRPVEVRFWEKVDRTTSPGGCWLWTAATSHDGYGQFYPRRGEHVYAHRFAYELLVGPIPVGLDLDHVRERGCLHRHCVNPAHLEPVTRKVNVLRGGSVVADQSRRVHCPQGHPYDEANTYIWRGHRRCRRCNADAAARRKAS